MGNSVPEMPSLSKRQRQCQRQLRGKQTAIAAQARSNTEPDADVAPDADAKPAADLVADAMSDLTAACEVGDRTLGSASPPVSTGPTAVRDHRRPQTPHE